MTDTDWFPFHQAGYGIRITAQGTVCGETAVSMACEVCGESASAGGGHSSRKMAEYHAARHHELDPDGGPDAGFGGYGWSEQNE